MSTTLADPPAQAAPSPPKWNMQQMVEKYVTLRDKKAALAKEQQEAMAPYNVALARLEAWMMDKLNVAGLDSAKTPSGTAYKSTTTSAKVMDWAATLAFIRETQVWDLLEARVSRTAVAAIMEETKQPIPGVAVTRETNVNVRRA